MSHWHRYSLICIQYVDLRTVISENTMNLLPQNTRPTKISEKEELFLSNLFSNGGAVVAAAVDAGYVKGSVGWLRNKLADEIIKRSKKSVSKCIGKSNTTSDQHNRFP